jgi:dolichol-phosphate mannosyltransferase
VSNSNTEPLQLLSVVTPAHDEEGCIGSTLEHLHLELRPNNIPHEIVVVDDGSADSSWQKLLELSGHIPELKPCGTKESMASGARLRRDLIA